MFYRMILAAKKSLINNSHFEVHAYHMQINQLAFRQVGDNLNIGNTNTKNK